MRDAKECEFEEDMALALDKRGFRSFQNGGLLGTRVWQSGTLTMAI